MMWATYPSRLWTILLLGLLLLGLLLPRLAAAVDTGLVRTKTVETRSGPVQFKPILQPYEPITGGYTHDSNDTGFTDVNLSLKVRLLPLNFDSRAKIHPYFAMSTRFGFYWGSRPNSPVIGKSYNPVLLLRFLPNERRIAGSSRSDASDPSDGSASHTVEQAEYIDFIPYAHQSNGNLIHTQQEYDAQLASLHVRSYTNDFIHRGWDYVGVVWKKSWFPDGPPSTDIATYVGGTYFLQRGFLQDPADEYHSWENNPEGKPRRAVDGLMLMIEYPSRFAHFATDYPCGRPNRGLCVLSRPNITIKYLTGYDTPFEYSTVRAEFGFQFFSLPLALWAQEGYMSSLAMYYQKATSWGLEVRFESF